MEAKISKTPMYCQENHKFEKDVVRNFLLFKWASRLSALSVWSYSHWPILQEFCTEEVKEFYNKKTIKQSMVMSPPKMCFSKGGIL